MYNNARGEHGLFVIHRECTVGDTVNIAYPMTYTEPGGKGVGALRVMILVLIRTADGTTHTPSPAPKTPLYDDLLKNMPAPYPYVPQDPGLHTLTFVTYDPNHPPHNPPHERGNTPGHGREYPFSHATLTLLVNAKPKRGAARKAAAARSRTRGARRRSPRNA